MGEEPADVHEVLRQGATLERQAALAEPLDEEGLRSGSTRLFVQVWFGLPAQGPPLHLYHRTGGKEETAAAKVGARSEQVSLLLPSTALSSFRKRRRQRWLLRRRPALANDEEVQRGFHPALEWVRLAVVTRIGRYDSNPLSEDDADGVLLKPGPSGHRKYLQTPKRLHRLPRPSGMPAQSLPHQTGGRRSVWKRRDKVVHHGDTQRPQHPIGRLRCLRGCDASLRQVPSRRRHLLPVASTLQHRPQGEVPRTAPTVHERRLLPVHD